MANITVPETPEFTDEIEKLETTTPGHASAWNSIHEKLFHNTLFLKAKEAVLETDIARAIAIALGRNQALVFSTYDSMVAWFADTANAEQIAALVNGTNLYIVATDVPDYWWSSTNQMYYQLETQKVDLTPYDNKIGTNDISGLSGDGTVTGALVELNSSLGGNKLISEGSGANAKYYIQLGADTASKKSLCSGTVRLLGNATSLRSACSFTVPKDAKLIVVVSSSNDRTMPENNISGIQSTTLSDISRGSWTGSEDACNFQHQKVYLLNAKSGDVITANASGTRFYICMSILSIE